MKRHADRKVDPLSTIDREKSYPRFGSAKGSIKMADDFDDFIEDFQEYAP